ncbi:MAG TPA: DUF805 domain-containing protein [Pseudorhodoplanes sp.]|nr:DUF805 domain-containing protein [Pseudorhodoplanes sp.]
MNLKYLFTNFSGRIGRQQFWIALATVIVVWIAVRFGTAELMDRSSVDTAYFLIVGMAVISLLLLLAVIPVLIKRLHDRNKSGHYLWLLLAAVVVSLSMPRADEPLPVLLAKLVLAAIWLWYFVELGFFRGTPGANAHGPDPLEAK